MNYPDGIKTGTLLRIKKHCLGSTTTKTCGEYAIIAPKLTKSGTSILWELLVNVNNCFEIVSLANN